MTICNWENKNNNNNNNNNIL